MTINDKVYKDADIDFGCVSNMQKMGVSIMNAEDKEFVMLAAYVAHCMNRPLKFAEDEINRHVINGGDLEDIFTVLSQKMEESDFFQALKKKAEKNSQPKPTK